MANSLRSKKGCWTCRLRKKKCDEAVPKCKICTGLSITCYGYGLKPDWMDNGDAERAITDGLRQIVKHTSRRKPRVSIPRKPLVKLARKPYTTSTTASDVEAALHSSDSPSQDETKDSSSSETCQQSGVRTIPAKESMLLMHFLDKVFPIQYPMYKPDIFVGGRGWILALLLRNRSLYHAALALSSYHRRIEIFESTSEPCRTLATVQQAKHVEACLIEIQQAIKSLNQSLHKRKVDSGMEIISSIVQLVFFELFAGQDGVWKTHLNAAINLCQLNCKDGLTHLKLSEVARARLCEDHPLKDEGASVTQEVVTFRFMGGTIVWLDILSSITAGTVPKLVSYHTSILSRESHTKLEDIMGCKNWVICLIGEIAALHGHQRHTTQGPSGYTDLNQQTIDLQKKAELVLAVEAMEGLDVVAAPGLDDYQADSITLVTRMFAYMAAVYMHLVAHGLQEFEKIDTQVQAAIDLLRTQIPSYLIPALVAPLFIIGCVSRQEHDRALFRNILTSRPFRDSLFKNRPTVSAAMEELWIKQEESTPVMWDDVLDFLSRQHQHFLLL